ncbi:uncharacterized protein MELLADRAFT_36939 [Melampsora larici-populina 98AG31]|uniref:Choline/ethanolaminephosphotransferase n=1 Tax=Melampsora larici-populina (strain 98AG31 / pathotype 3-4-7) TaxID=747676 RepID=F4RQW0_MELLP|nr:uncharacterized protein MELLADRAFT_36939 [Melampsora larici-populina 98AG31]EGG05258.1 hypothetical protein MELLADRAFT_36939 [Melampsora larici-populina 98AG31]
MFNRPHYIPRNRRQNLSKYKYSGEDHSIVSKYVLTPYWNRLVTYFPMNMAPNLITLTGLGFVLINFGSLLIFEPSLECSIKPTHVSRGLWIYQSLDAIDGKQARRTGTSGPLGEMFDHGCDALNTTLGCILASGALNLGQSWWTVSSQVASLANFYLTTWEEYHTGTLYLSSFSGPVEGILLVIGVFLITSVFGWCPGFWDQGILTVTGLNSIGFIKSLHLKDLPLNECSLLFAIISLGSNTVGSYFNVVKARKGKGGSNLSTLLGLLPFVIQTVVNLIWLKTAPMILNRHLILFMIYYGIGFAYLVGLLIVSHITLSPELFPYWNLLLIWSCFGMMDSVSGNMLGWKTLFHSDELSSVRFLWFSILVETLVYGYFVFDVILDVCDYFQINCLTIKHQGQRLGNTRKEQESLVDKKKSSKQKSK